MADREWGNMVLRRVRLVGKCGPQRGCRGGTGAKIHLLSVEEVVGVVNPSQARPGTAAARFLRGDRPVYHSVNGECNGNGQHTGYPVDGLTFADITCARCRKWAERWGLMRVGG